LSWTDTVGNFAKKLQGNGFANDIGLPTLLFDIASVSSNDKNWVGDAFNIAGDTFRTGVLTASFPIRKAAGFAIQEALLPAAQVSYETGGRILREPLSAGFTTLATGNAKKAWENRDEISPAQALTYLQSKIPLGAAFTAGAAAGLQDEGFDIFDPNDRKVFETDFALRTLSGTYDTFFTTVTDPLGKLAKGAGLARKALVTRPMGAVDANASTLARDFFMPKSIRKTTIISPETLARTINEGREEGGELYNTLSWMAKSDQVALRSHEMIDLSNDGDTLSYLLGEAKTVDDVADTFMATALKDKEAMARLVTKRKDLAFVLDKIKDTSTTELDMLDNIPTNGITSNINKLDSADALIKTLDEDVYFRYLTTLNDKGADLTKRTFGTSPFEKMAINRAERRTARVRGKANDIDTPTNFPTVGYFQPTKYHPLVAVVNFGLNKVGDAFQEMPAGYINLNDSDSYNEIAAFGGLLRRVVGDEANPIIERHLNDYIQSGGTPELRARVVESFEDLAITSINRKLGISDEAGAQIWGAYKSRRETARSMIRDRKFLMTDDDVILKIPYLERQGANALPMVDLANYERVITKNKGLLTALEGGFNVVDPDSFRYTTAILNDMWKASVLLRLGYTIRNVSEGALSMMAKGYGLMALGDLNQEGFNAWYSNRVRDVERITDRRLVSQGQRDDSVLLRRLFAEKQYEFRAADRMYNQLLAYLPAAERAYLRGNLDETQLKEIIDVFQYSTGEYLYHGTPTAIDGFDATRPLAMSLSQDTAGRYADAGMPMISASEIYKRKTGRAYAMPKNLRDREGELLKDKRKPSLAIETIAADMRDGFINSTNNGNQVELLNPQTGQWRSIDPNTVSQKMLVNGTFRIRKPGNQGAVLGNKVYGKQIDLRLFNGNRAKLGLKDYPELQKILGVGETAGWKTRAAWEGKESQLLDWMRANNVGKLLLPDTKANGNATVLVDPNMVEAFGQQPSVMLAERRLNSIKNQQQAIPDEAGAAQIIDDTIEPMGGANGARRVIGTEDFAKRIDELEAILSTGKYPTGGLVNLVREFADGQSAAKRDMEGLLNKLDARLVEEGRIAAPRQIQGTGRRTETLYDGSTMEIDDAFRGEGGQILLSRTDNGQTYRNFVDHPSQLFSAEHTNFTEARLTPKMPEYYTGYANQMNTFFRSPDGRVDPIIEMFLNGMKPEQVVRWLRDPKNVDYARRFNIDVPGIKVMSERLNVSMEADDFVGDLYSAYNRYLPDRQVQEAFRNGEVDEQWLRTHFMDNPDMPDIIGRIVPTSPEAANWREGMSKVVERAFHFLGSLPETTVARHPLARQIYRAEYKNRANIALATKRLNEGDAAELTVDEINNLRRNVIESTRREVNNTLFTIIRKSYAGEKMRFIMPFFNAWENTIRRWYGLTKDNPAVVARAGQIVSSLRNQPNVVDRDGNTTTEFSYENKIVLPMPEGAIKTVSLIPGWGKGMAEALRSSGTQVSIPIRSLDILFQGEALAGFGPIVTIPVNQLVLLKPDLEDLVTSTVLPVLPFGPQEGSIRQLFPPAAQKLISLLGQDEAWSRTFNTVYRYELIRFNLGDRDTLPELDEVKKLSDSMYQVKMLSNLVMPFAAQYESPLTFYTQQFRRLNQVYGADAEALFLEMYPEMGAALVSSSYNPTGATASQAAFKNIQKYDKLIGKIGQTTPEMIGFLVNDPDGKYDFSEAVYAWQYGNAPVAGSTENYRQRRNPADLKKDANIKMGWIEFRKNMNLLDSQLFAQGYNSYSESGAEELQTLKSMMVADMTGRNKDWAVDYYSVDRGKWVYRMESMKTMLSDPTWMKENSARPVVQSISVYLNVRSQIARELASRKAYGMASTLAAKDNEDLDGLWNQTVAQLLQGSTEFEDFYNRFLQNDPVTLG
jgi:hypothetical protein